MLKSWKSLSALWLAVFTVALSGSAYGDFLCDIYINGAENPSLTFGENATPKQTPFPPFSGMYGVVDVCFTGEANAPEWYDRLADNIKAPNNDNAWELVAKSNASVKFQKQSGSMENLFIQVLNIDSETGNYDDSPSAPLQDGQVVTLKQGSVCRILRNPDTPLPSLQNNSKFAKKEEPTSAILAQPEFSPETLTISLAAGTSVIAYDGNILTNNGGTAPQTADWNLLLAYNGQKIPFANATYNQGVLAISLDNLNPSTRAILSSGNEGFSMEMTPLKSSASPIQTHITFSNDAQSATEVLDWILLKFGTLDFDGDGNINNADAMYLYNFVAAGCPAEAEDEDEEADIVKSLLDFTSKARNPTEADLAAAKTAITLFRQDPDALKFDGSAGSPNNLDAMYLYNYVAAGCPAQAEDEDEEADIVKSLLDFTSKGRNPSEADIEAAKQAIQTMRDYKDNL